MKLLIIAPYLPMPDRGSEELRFSEILEILAASHKVTLFVWTRWGESVGEAEQSGYEDAIRKLGVEIRVGHLRKVLKEQPYDTVMIEWFHAMDRFGEDIRTWQPDAKIIIDAVDLEYRRLKLKADVSGNPVDLARAEDTRRRELAAYANADFVMTVSEEERMMLTETNASLHIVSVPNIHRFPDTLPTLTEDPVMIFVGDYRVPPNVDAVSYFCASVLPLIHNEVPQTRLLLVGNAPTDEVKGLATERVTVTGYVPEVAPYLARSRVSVAPLRYGAGMKGKVGEAMSHGIPVVTTSVGFQGMEMENGKESLVADTPEDFAAAVLKLFRDPALCEKIRRTAWNTMKERFGVEAARRRLEAILSEVAALPPPHEKYSSARRLQRKSVDWLERNILWRFQ